MNTKNDVCSRRPPDEKSTKKNRPTSTSNRRRFFFQPSRPASVRRSSDGLWLLHFWSGTLRSQNTTLCHSNYFFSIFFFFTVLVKQTTCPEPSTCKPRRAPLRDSRLNFFCSFKFRCIHHYFAKTYNCITLLQRKRNKAEVHSTHLWVK